MNTIPDIFVFDDLHPEDNAMIQALYSRSPDSVLNHLEKVKSAGSGNFMAQYYVGYGHQSIGDCGSTTIFIENVSMLAAKAIQDSPLYRGQEASTRYLNFNIQPQYNPYEDRKEATEILQAWLELYNRMMPIVVERLKTKYPNDDATKHGVWQKTTQVRAFDILRSLLPIGTTTSLSWHTDLRHASDHLRYLSLHPLQEVRNIAKSIASAMVEKYPNSFNADAFDVSSERYADRNAYAQSNALDSYYVTPSHVKEDLNDSSFIRFVRGKVEVVRPSSKRVKFHSFLKDRPRGAPLPRKAQQLPDYTLYFLLDFGSFRDIQRHRNGYCPIPFITGEYGFHEGYLTALKDILHLDEYTRFYDQVNSLLNRVESFGKLLYSDPLDTQYLYPMGIACGCTVTYSLPQMVYVSELRSAKTVHFTLRPIAWEMAKIVQNDYPQLDLYIDYDQDSFSLKRGTQDITPRADKVE